MELRRTSCLLLPNLLLRRSSTRARTFLVDGKWISPPRAVAHARCFLRETHEADIGKGTNQLTEVLKKLEPGEFVHGDIPPRNILVSKSEQA